MARKKAKATGALESRSFKRSMSQAEKYAKDVEKTTRLIERAMKKSEGLSDKSLPEMWDYFKALVRFIDAGVRRRYTAMPWSSLLLSLAGVIYLVSPIDFIPDFIPIAGFLDDVTILAYVIRQLKTDLDAFLVWERKQVPVVIDQPAAEA